MFNLAWIRNDGHLERINWRDMGPEELGSVYESLLELEPVLSLEARSFTFAESEAARGNARKTSGSYYTPDSLVQELLDSALEPVIAKRTAGAEDPEAALLAISVCDPACGSGHFLLGAARRLATHLAQLRAQGTPTGEDFRHALRDVITHSIFGVDRNPMAIELARMSLWLEAMTPDRPLGFLDHHLQVGDALLGLADLAVLEQGIPKDAFKPLSGDDKTACRQLAARNAAELKDLSCKRAARKAGQADWHAVQSQSLAEFRALEALPDATLAEIAAKQAAWQAFAAEATQSPLRRAADLWLGAFLLPKTGATHIGVPTTGSVVLELLGESVPAEHAARRDAARAACAEARVLHWPLAFPLVHAAGGFACVLANPPWERIKLQEEEFFASRHADVAQARNKAERSQRIQWLSEGMLAAHLAPESGHSDAQARSEQRLYAEFIAARREAEAASVFAHVDGKDGGRYPLTGVGDVNTYALFAETMTNIIARAGRAGFIVQSGIGTDDSTKRYFQSLVNANRLISFLGFDNAKRIFPAVHPDTPFALVTVGESSRPAQLAHYILSIDQLADPRRRFTLTPDEFRLINPNTLTCPVFRSERDAELTKKLYRAAPVLIDETRADGNPWGISFMAMFHMSNDSHLFADAPGNDRLPLYEAKLIHQFDHRWATYEAGSSRDVTDAEKADPAFTITPRYWVDASEVQARLAAKDWSYRWLMGFRCITNATNERTVIATVVPLTGAGNSLPILGLAAINDHRRYAGLLANMGSLAFDFVARQKVGGTNLNFFIFQQFSAFPPSRYTDADLAFIVPRVLELTYTADDLKAWAEDLGYAGPPFPFDPDRRAQLRAELDATYARLYGLTRDELRYILDPADVMGEDYPSETFRVLKNYETRAFGEYRTRRLVLAAWDRLESGELD
jgi:hypothetical protein